MSSDSSRLSHRELVMRGNDKWTAAGALVVVGLGVGLTVLTARTEEVRTAAGVAQGPKEKQQPTKGPGGLPITGKGLTALAPIDEAVEKIMLRRGVPGAALAVTRDGKLVHARGYGWGFYEKNELATPETLFGL